MLIRFSAAEFRQFLEETLGHYDGAINVPTGKQIKVSRWELLGGGASIGIKYSLIPLSDKDDK